MSPFVACTCVWSAPLERVLSFVWTGWDGAGWHSAELHGKKRVACCVCGPRQAWGKPVSTGDIIGRKNNKIRSRPSRSSPALPSAPSSASCPWTLLLHPVSFSFSLLLTSLPLSSSDLCSPTQHHLPSSTSKTNYLTNSPSARLSRTFLNSNHFYIITSTVYLAFLWRFSLKQMVYWLRNAFIHASANMSEALCTCWGLNSTSNSLKGITLILFVEEAMWSFFFFYQVRAESKCFFHPISGRDLYFWDNTEQISDTTHTECWGEVTRWIQITPSVTYPEKPHPYQPVYVHMFEKCSIHTWGRKRRLFLRWCIRSINLTTRLDRRNSTLLTLKQTQPFQTSVNSKRRRQTPHEFKQRECK